MEGGGVLLTTTNFLIPFPMILKDFHLITDVVKNCIIGGMTTVPYSFSLSCLNLLYRLGSKPLSRNSFLFTEA